MQWILLKTWCLQGFMWAFGGTHVGHTMVLSIKVALIYCSLSLTKRMRAHLLILLKVRRGVLMKNQCSMYISLICNLWCCTHGLTTWFHVLTSSAWAQLVLSSVWCRWREENIGPSSLLTGSWQYSWHPQTIVASACVLTTTELRLNGFPLLPGWPQTITAPGHCIASSGNALMGK